MFVCFNLYDASSSKYKVRLSIYNQKESVQRPSIKHCKNCITAKKCFGFCPFFFFLGKKSSPFQEKKNNQFSAKQ